MNFDSQQWQKNKKKKNTAWRKCCRRWRWSCSSRGWGWWSRRERRACRRPWSAPGGTSRGMRCPWSCPRPASRSRSRMSLPSSSPCSPPPFRDSFSAIHKETGIRIQDGKTRIAGRDTYTHIYIQCIYRERKYIPKLWKVQERCS